MQDRNVEVLTEKITAPRVLALAYDALGGGATRAAIDVATWMHARKIPLQLSCLKREGDFVHQMDAISGVNYLLAKGLSLRRHIGLIFPKLWREASKCDVILAVNENSALFLAIVLGFITRKPVIAWFHIHWSQQHRNNPWWHKPIMRLLLPNTAKVIAVSGGVANDLLVEIPRLKENKVVVLPLPTHFDNIRALANIPLSVNYLQTIPKQKTILAIGRLTPQKGFDLLLKALASEALRDRSWRLILVGSGPCKAALQGLSNTLGIDRSIVWCDFTDNPYPFYKIADLFVLPSRYEGLGIVLLEALCCGVPVIATDCPSGPAEILRGGQFGKLVPPEDVEALARGISDMLDGSEKIDANDLLKLYDLNNACQNILNVLATEAQRCQPLRLANARV